VSGLVAIVPVKRLHAAKSRLAPALDPDERAALVVDMLRSVLAALAASGAVAERLVVSPDPAALAVARVAGAATLWQPDDGLNAALEQARASLPPRTALLALPADLPLLRADEVVALVTQARGVDVVVAPDSTGDGTNALALAPGVALPFAFGPGSFRRHLAAAGAAGMTVAVIRAPGLALDLDSPADLAELQRHGWAPALPTGALSVAMDAPG
jgi:2-phospho-L-lactate guanylyltransferase